MDSFKKYDRVVVVMDYKSNGRIIPEGTVGTYRSLIDDNMVVQVLGPTGVQFTTLPDTVLRHAEKEELDGLTPELMVPKIYHPGNVWSVQIGYNGMDPVYRTGEVIGIRLFPNEAYDKIKIRFYDDGTEKEYEKRFLENHGSYMPANIPEFEEDIQEERKNG